VKELFTFVSLIETPKGEKNQNKGNGTKNAKCKILVRSILPYDYYLVTACSNREARKASKRLRSGSLVRIVMGSEKDNFPFLTNTPVIHVSNIQEIKFYETD